MVFKCYRKLSIPFLVNSILLHLTLINKEQHCLGEGEFFLFFLEVGGWGLLFSLGREQGVSCCLCFAYIILGDGTQTKEKKFVTMFLY